MSNYPPESAIHLSYAWNDPRHALPEQPEQHDWTGAQRPQDSTRGRRSTRQRNEAAWSAMSGQVTRAGTSYDAGSESIRDTARAAGGHARIVGDDEGGRLTGFTADGRQTRNHTTTVSRRHDGRSVESQLGDTKYLYSDRVDTETTSRNREYFNRLRRHIGGYKDF